MRKSLRAFFIVALAVIGFIGLQQSAAADFQVQTDSGDMTGLSLGDSFNVYLSIQPDDDGKTYWAGGFFSVGDQAQFVPTDRFDYASPGYLTIRFTVNQVIYDSCANTGAVGFSNTGRVFEANGSGQPVLYMNDTGTFSCSIASPAYFVAVYAPTLVEEVCGPNNDVYSQTSPIPSNGATVQSFPDWENNQRTITYVPADDFQFTTESTFTVFDENEPCAPVTIGAPKISAAICGPNNDEIVLGAVDPIGGATLSKDSSWVENERTLTYIANPGFTITTAASFTLEDDDITCIPLVAPFVSTAICGPNNDEVTVPDQHPGVATMTNGPWYNGTYSVKFETFTNYGFPPGTQVNYELEDFNIPCVTPVQPTVVEVCGPENDVISVPEQPTGVTVSTSDGWANDTFTVEFSAAEGYAFPPGAIARVEITDRNVPCPEGVPVPPVQVTICGPNNDDVVIPVQPDGVIVESSLNWVDGTWTVIFAAAEGFTLPEGTQATYTLVDENTACPIPIQRVTIIVTMPDASSAEGASWQIFAPTASQVAMPPFAEGTVGADSTFLLPELVPDDYRLVIAAEGYETLNQTITIAPDTTEITVRMAALQVVPTPTVTATATATVAPAPTESSAAPVTSLPETGTGSGTGASLAAPGIIASILLIAWTSFHRRNILP